MEPALGVLVCLWVLIGNTQADLYTYPDLWNPAHSERLDSCLLWSSPYRERQRAGVNLLAHPPQLSPTMFEFTLMDGSGRHYTLHPLYIWYFFRKFDSILTPTSTASCINPLPASTERLQILIRREDMWHESLCTWIQCYPPFLPWWSINIWKFIQI